MTSTSDDQAMLTESVNPAFYCIAPGCKHYAPFNGGTCRCCQHEELYQGTNYEGPNMSSDDQAVDTTLDLDKLEQEAKYELANLRVRMGPNPYRVVTLAEGVLALVAALKAERERANKLESEADKLWAYAQERNGHAKSLAEEWVQLRADLTRVEAEAASLSKVYDTALEHNERLQARIAELEAERDKWEHDHQFCYVREEHMAEQEARIAELEGSLRSIQALPADWFARP